MATNRSTQVALTFALSLFVMLTVVLGVTTYLFFTKRQEADEAQGTAERQAAQVQAQLQATKDEMVTLRGIIGVAEDTPVADIETGLATLFEGDFAGFTGDQKSYLKLIEWLRGEFRDKSAKVATAEAERKESKAKADAAVQAAMDAQKQAETAAATAKQGLLKTTEDFNAKWAGHEKKQGKLLQEKEAAERAARELETLKNQIVGVGDYLSPTLQTGFAERDSGSQIDLLRNELHNQRKLILRLNDLLSKARIADPALQELVAEFRLAEDRIEGFDGRVIDIDPRSGVVLVSTPSTRGVRPGLMLQVYSPVGDRPQFRDQKAVLEVADIEGPNLIRTIIRREKPRDPILSGDGVASSLWSPGGSPAIVVVGFVDLDGDGRSDKQELTTLATQAGGRVIDGVTADTALVVDLGKPPADETRDEDKDELAEERRRTLAIKNAKFYGTRVGGLDDLLDMLGLDANALRANRLPATGSAGR